MGNSVQSEPVIRFQDFQVNLDTGEVWKNGIRLKLQDQPFKVLVALLERPGEVVTREELHKLIWPQESFGDFDHAINLAVNKLRATLGDSADVPHLIETLPRRGYRFIGTIEGCNAPKPEPQPTPPKHFAAFKTRWIWLVAGAAVFILMSTFGLIRFLRNSAQPSSAPLEMISAVSMPGVQDRATISPDGKQIAFGEYGDRPGIYMTLIDGGKPLRLTENEHDGYPSWSPDGSQIAFARFSGYQKSIYIIPALGGSEHRVYSTARAPWMECDALDWSPDGKFLVFAVSVEDGARSRLTLLSLSDLSTHPITYPANQQFDCQPTFSPDGASVAFARGSMGSFMSDVFVMKIAGGDPVRLTYGNSGGTPAWTADGRELVFSSAAGGMRTLWRVSALGGTPRPVTGAVENAWTPSIARNANRLVYTQYNVNAAIWRLDLKDDRHIAGPPVRLISGRGFNWKPSFSPDGKKIAFESDRLGYMDVWMCDSDGSNCSQLTSHHGQSDSPRWSPDGRYIAFESISKDFYNIYLLELAEGAPHPLPTFSGANNGIPNWSRDGKWIYFYSAHEKGRYQLWKIPFQGGVPVRVTQNGGIYAIESYDGRALYYAKFEEPGIWKRSLDGGEDTRILDQPYHLYWNNWAVGPTGIYFVNRIGYPKGRIEFFDFATRTIVPIFTPNESISMFGGPALSPDGKSLLISLENHDSNVMLLKNFH